MIVPLLDQNSGNATDRGEDPQHGKRAYVPPRSGCGDEGETKMRGTKTIDLIVGRRPGGEQLATMTEDR